MAITIPTAASIGAFSEDVAADAAEQGNYGPRIANALLVLAAEATADIAAVEGGGGGEFVRLATFTAPATSSNTALQAETDLIGAGATLTLTLTGSYARGLKLTVASGTITGNVSVTGPNPAGGSHTENVTQASGSTVKVFGPGTITVVIPTSTCRYSFGTTDWIGLPSAYPAKDVTGTGVGMQLALLWGGVPYVPELPDTGKIRTASLTGGYGAWLPSSNSQLALDGSTTAVLSYIATA